MTCSIGKALRTNTTKRDLKGFLPPPHWVNDCRPAVSNFRARLISESRGGELILIFPRGLDFREVLDFREGLVSREGEDVREGLNSMSSLWVA